MKFETLCRLPDATFESPETAPTILIRQAIERESGKVFSLYGTNAGWDCVCQYECQSPEAQVRITLTLKRAGFRTETRNLIEGPELDKAWENAVKHPVGASAR